MALFGAFGIFQMPNQNRVLVDMLAACRLVEPGAERIAADKAKLAGIIGRPHHTGRPVYISSKFREKCWFDRDFQRASLRTSSHRRTGSSKTQRKRKDRKSEVSGKRVDGVG